LSASATLTTTSPNDIIIAYVAAAGSYPNVPTSSHLTFSLRQYLHTGTGNPNVAEYFAVAHSVLSSEVITATDVGSSNEIQIVVFGVSGASTSSPFDPGALPKTATGTTGIPSATISTSFANDLIIGLEGDDSGASGGGPLGGFTLIANVVASDTADSMGAEYKIVAATQTNLSVQYTDSTVAQNWGMIADALQDPPATGVPQFSMGLLPILALALPALLLLRARLYRT